MIHVASSPDTLVDVLRTRAAVQANEVAYHFLRQEGLSATTTYRQLDRRARAIGRRLVIEGLSGERVVLLFSPGLEYIAAFFGCLYAAAIAVPACPPRPRRPLRRLQSIIADSAASAVLTVSDFASDLQQRVDGDASWRDLKWINCDQIETRQEDEDWSGLPISPESLALLQYTSGSTGDPKGVMVTHGNLIHNLGVIHRGFGINSTAMGVSWLPFYHDMGLVGGILAPLFAGRPATLLSPVSFLQRPAMWLQAISDYGGTISGGPNFAYELCVDRITPDQRQSLDLSSWRTAYCGAEPIRQKTLERFHQAFATCGFRREAFYPCFGLAEATLMVTGGNVQRAPQLLQVTKLDLANHDVRLAVDDENRDESITLVGCGRALPDQKVVIVDPDARTPCGKGRVGEIWVCSPSVAKGYWGRKDLSRETFQARLADEDTCYLRTGDLGCLHNGELYVTGRLKDLIILRGRNHYPHDVEQTVERCHRALRPAGSAAFAVDVGGEERLVVVQEVERGARKENLEAALQTIREAIAREHGIEVHAVMLVKALSVPKTSSGKVQRNACRQQYLKDALPTVAGWVREPSSAPKQPIGAEETTRGRSSLSKRQIQQWLLQSIARRLGTTDVLIDAHRPFDTLGLDSLAAVELTVELEAWLSRKLSPALVYEFPDIDALAAHLADPQSVDRRAGGAGPSPYSEPVAIVGIGCRFPGGGNDPQVFWQTLVEGVDAIREVPAERWNMDDYYDPNPDVAGKMSTRWAGLLDDVDCFDLHFFGITPREVQSMDPQQRVLLEVAWQALEDAGLSPDSLAGTPTGVFAGVCSNDYARLLQSQTQITDIGAYHGTGSAFSVTAGRLSYVLGLQGPSLPVDTACSSSLVAVHLACQSLLRNECRVALAGGVNLILAPDAMVYFSKVRAMAADGRCKAFDKAADGYVRGEGCGVVVLKRLSEAVTDGDRIWALIRGSAVNHDGGSNGLTAPNPAAQADVIRQALTVSGVNAADVGYVEAHGTGTALGDPIELQALDAVYAADRPAERKLMVGSAKTNIGHLEAAAGVAGLIKAALILRHGEIPPHLHLRELNPLIPQDRMALTIPVRRTPWLSAGRRRLAGVSSFGFSGTNAHVILEQCLPLPSARAPTAWPAHLFVLSAKTAAALQDLVSAYQQYLSQERAIELADVCHTAAVGRSHFSNRLAVITDSPDDLSDKLASIAQHERHAGVYTGQAEQATFRISFVAAGQSTNGAEANGSLKPVAMPAPDCHPSEWASFLEYLAGCYVEGASVDWSGLHRGCCRQKVSLPTYPFRRQSHWFAKRDNDATLSTESPNRMESGVGPTSVEPRGAAILPDEPSAKQILDAPCEARAAVTAGYLRALVAKAMETDASEIALDRNLMEMGLDSLMAMDIIDDVKRDLDFTLYPREVYQRPSIAALADYLADELSGDPRRQHQDSARVEVSLHRAENLMTHRPDPEPALTGPPIPGGVFLLSAPRSGSTLLRVMLAGHADVFAPPELHLLPFDDMGEREEVLGTSHLGEGLTRALMGLEGLVAEQAKQRTRHWIDRQTPVDAVYRQLAESSQPRLLVDKSPSYVGRLETLQRAEVWFERPRYVFLVRHPLAVIESLIRMRMDKLLGDGSHDPEHLAEEIWNAANHNVLAFLEAVNPRRSLIIKYEDLVTRPEAEMRRLADFLKIPYASCLLTPYQGDRMTDGISSVSAAVADPNFLKHNRVDASLADAWKQVQLSRQLSTKTVHTAEQLGYSREQMEQTWAASAAANPTNSRKSPLPPPALHTGQRPSGSGLQPMPSVSAPAPMREEFIQVNGLSLCLCSWGPPDGQAVLCLHGILDQGLCWQLVADRLRGRGLRLLAPDLRGHGRSNHIGAGCSYQLQDFVSDADAVLRTLGDRRIILVGHSLGAAVATHLALARPQRIARLIAVEPPLLNGQSPSLERQLATYLDEMAQPAAHSRMADVNEAVARLHRAAPQLPPELANALAWRCTCRNDDGWTWSWDARLRSRHGLQSGPTNFASADVAGLLSELAVPVTVLQGTHSAQGRDDHRGLLAGRVAEHELIDGGHNLPMEAAGEVAGAIARAMGNKPPSNIPSHPATGGPTGDARV